MKGDWIFSAFRFVWAHRPVAAFGAIVIAFWLGEKADEPLAPELAVSDGLTNF
jgi:hypothetical protein